MLCLIFLTRLASVVFSTALYALRLQSICRHNLRKSWWTQLPRIRARRSYFRPPSRDSPAMATSIVALCRIGSRSYPSGAGDPISQTALARDVCRRYPEGSRNISHFQPLRVGGSVYRARFAAGSPTATFKIAASSRAEKAAKPACSSSRRRLSSARRAAQASCSSS
jgi:hypothetical protein